jgi:F0F1-type ATP synthase epsilon subunit
LNKAGLKRQAVAVLILSSGDLILTTDEEGTRTEWLQHTQWLQVLGGGARIKKIEFIVIAHEIRVNQVLDQARAKEEIYKQNPKLRGHVEILRLAWKKKLLYSRRTTGPLHINVAEPEQANTSSIAA